MVGAAGGKFECIVPSSPWPREVVRYVFASLYFSTDLFISVSNPKKAKEAKEDSPKATLKKIKKTLGKGCFTKTIDYWTYEVCPFKTVKQYHQDGNSRGDPKVQ